MVKKYSFLILIILKNNGEKFEIQIERNSDQKNNEFRKIHLRSRGSCW
jgi:hypothetical protein